MPGAEVGPWLEPGKSRRRAAARKRPIATTTSRNNCKTAVSKYYDARSLGWPFSVGGDSTTPTSAREPGSSTSTAPPNSRRAPGRGVAVSRAATPCGWHGTVAEFLALDQATLPASLWSRHLQVMGAPPSGDQAEAWRGEHELPREQEWRPMTRNKWVTQPGHVSSHSSG